MDKYLAKISDKKIFFISPDVKRGLGLECRLPNYHIICSYYDPLIGVLRNQGANIFCLEEHVKRPIEKYTNSGKLLENEWVTKYLHKNSEGQPYILTFKPNLKLEIICQKNKYHLLNNKSEIAEVFENKISFYRLCRKHFPQYCVTSIIGVLGELDFVTLVKKLRLPFVIQFSHGWAGKTTFIIKKEQDFLSLRVRFGQTQVKASQLIRGFTVLNNAAIYGKKIFVSPPALQLSGISELYEKPFVTCGRQWPVKYLTRQQTDTVKRITEKIGELMKSYGYRGYYGLDFLVDKSDGRIYLTEDNARFTASTPFWTKLEIGYSQIPLIYYHLAEFLGYHLPVNYGIENEITGSQIIFRDKRHQPRFGNKVDFGVYRNKENTWELVGKNYQPEKLAQDEIIFMKKNYLGKLEDIEYSRIECREEVTADYNQLQDWVLRLLS